MLLRSHLRQQLSPAVPYSSPMAKSSQASSKKGLSITTDSPKAARVIECMPTLGQGQSRNSTPRRRTVTPVSPMVPLSAPVRASSRLRDAAKAKHHDEAALQLRKACMKPQSTNANAAEPCHTGDECAAEGSGLNLRGDPGARESMLGKG